MDNPRSRDRLVNNKSASPNSQKRVVERFYSSKSPDVVGSHIKYLEELLPHVCTVGLLFL